MISFFNLISAGLGLFRNGLLASYFGAGADLDVYYAAFRIPDFIYNIFIAGSISAAFIPLFNKFLNQSKEDAWRFTNNILTILLLILGFLALVLFIFAPFAMSFIAPGFDEKQVESAVRVSRMILLQPILLGASALIAGCLQSFKRFLANALAPVLYNLGIIAGIMVFAPLFGIKGVALGVVFGAILHFSIQFLSLKNLGFKFRPLFNLRAAAVREMFFLMLPRTLSLLSAEIVSFVYVAFASAMAVGSLAIFNLTSSLQALPISIFGVAFAVAAFPALSQNIDNKEEFLKIIKKTAVKIICLLLPITILYFILKGRIIKLVLGYGNFDIAAQSIASDVLFIFSFGILAAGALPFLIRIFFSMGDTKTPLLASVFGGIIAIILAAIFAESLGPKALALAMICSSWINAAVLILILRKKLAKQPSA